MPHNDELFSCDQCEDAAQAGRWELAEVVRHANGDYYLDLRDTLDSMFGVRLTLTDLKHLEYILLRHISATD